ncbi:uncharacterized protein [Argopecten irradians]|uniref:uncharacterized protein n=1 Tax=Argopecten irradians TaxID=31199 RepID=UPI003711CFFD
MYQMPSTSKGQAGPYSKSLRLAVCHINPVVEYTNQKGEAGRMLVVGLADQQKAWKATCYDSTKFQHFSVGSAVLLRNFIDKGEDNIVLTKFSKVFRTGQMEVPQNLAEEATKLVDNRAPDVVPIKAAGSSPEGKRLTIQGRVTQASMRESVKIKNVPTAIRHLVLQDASASIKVSLWREHAEAAIHPGVYLHISNVINRPYRGMPQLSTTCFLELQKTEAPEETVMKTFIAYELQEENVILIPDGDGDEELIMQKSVLLNNTDSATNDELMKKLDNLCPELKAECIIKGTDIVKLKLMS